MVLHVVMWKLKDSAEGAPAAENAAAIKQRLEALVGVVPGLLESRVYTGGIAGGFDLCLLSKLQDAAALEVYRDHPAHDAVRQFINKVVAERAAFDGECEA